MRNPNIKIDIGLIPSSRMAFPAVLVELVEVVIALVVGTTVEVVIALVVGTTALQLFQEESLSMQSVMKPDWKQREPDVVTQ